MAKTAKKKVTKKASVTALPATDSIPEGFEKIGGGYAPTWKPEEQKTIHGKVTGGVRDIELTIRKEKRNVRCMEVTQKKTGVLANSEAPSPHLSGSFPKPPEHMRYEAPPWRCDGWTLVGMACMTFFLLSELARQEKLSRPTRHT